MVERYHSGTWTIKIVENLTKVLIVKNHKLYFYFDFAMVPPPTSVKSIWLSITTRWVSLRKVYLIIIVNGNTNICP